MTDLGTREELFVWEKPAEWNVIPDETVAILKEYLERGEIAEVLKSKADVAVGFVDGDIELVHRTLAFRWVRIPECAKKERAYASRRCQKGFDCVFSRYETGENKGAAGALTRRATVHRTVAIYGSNPRMCQKERAYALTWCQKGFDLHFLPA